MIFLPLISYLWFSCKHNNIFTDRWCCILGATIFITLSVKEFITTEHVHKAHRRTHTHTHKHKHTDKQTHKHLYPWHLYWRGFIREFKHKPSCIIMHCQYQISTRLVVFHYLICDRSRCCNYNTLFKLFMFSICILLLFINLSIDQDIDTY